VGPLTCAPGELCFFERFGACPRDLALPDDGGSASSGGGGGTDTCGQYSCAKLPSSCACDKLCGGPGGQYGPTGCLHSVPACQYAVAGCKLEGSMITCGDQ
jgi:hypothetical protein